MTDKSIIKAASILLAREESSHELFVVRRALSLRFFGGYHAFPGGKLNPEDEQIPLHSSNGSVHDPQQVAVIRELFEETGALIAHHDNGSFPTSTHQWTKARQQLIDEAITFQSFLQHNRLHLEAADLTFVGRLVTPSFSKLRFDTAFYSASLPPGQEVGIWPGELDDGFWITSDAMLRCWEQNQCLISPPTISMLRSIRGLPIAQVAQRFRPILEMLEQGKTPCIPFAPGVDLLPLRTKGLPPANTTNAYLVGTDQTWLMDPGSHEPQEQEKLFEALDSVQDQGRPLNGILLTHHHSDHVDAVMPCAQRYNIPVCAHPRTAELLNGKVKVSHFLKEGDRIPLGQRPDGNEQWHLKVLHLPGHASGHLVFFEPHYQMVFAGDLVSMLSSVVIAPPDGDLTQYLASLKRLQSLEARLLFPGHGSPSSQPRKVVEGCLSHRARREEQLVAALSQGPMRISELVQSMYSDLEPQLQRLAALQVQAGLNKLQQEGRAHNLGEEEGLYQLVRVPADDNKDILK